MTKNITLGLIAAIVSLVSVLLISCGTGSSGGSSQGETVTGSVALYATDDLSLDYSEVRATINNVQLVQVQTGIEMTCNLLNAPVNLDITNLSSIIQLLNISECISINYNKIQIDFNEQVVLTDKNNSTSECIFTSYKDKHDIPSALQCAGGTCTMEMDGEFNVLPAQTSEFALDFDLKKFTVNDFNLPSCSVTMKINPLNRSGIAEKHDEGYEDGIAGYISEAAMDQKRLTIATDSGTFLVDYSNVAHINIDSLLGLARDDNLQVMVKSSAINLNSHEIIASDIHITIPPKPLVKNIIVMISDGWGFNHLEAASYYEYGKDARQIYNRFPFNFAMSTYMAYDEDECYGQGYDPDIAWRDFEYVKSCATDSAAAATAMSTGVKTYEGAIGVNLNKEVLKNILEVAEGLGKKTGVVSSVPFSHATPAAFVAHNVSRNNYSEIAQEMIYDSAADVIMGTGHPWYDADGQPKVTPDTFMFVGGQTTWDDLVAGIAGGDADGDGVDDSWTLIQTRAEFQALTDGPTPKRVIGIPQIDQTLQQGRSGDPDADPYIEPFIETVPTLEEMTRAALNILDDDTDGLFLMVEGGAIDWASHGNQSGRMIEEQIDFERAVEAVVHWVKKNSNWGETLLIVTGDHETGYLTGPGSDPTWESIVNNGAGNLPGMEWHSTEHTNSLMVISAKGDAARLLHRYADQRDPVRGPLVDNTDVAQVLFRSIGFLP